MNPHRRRAPTHGGPQQWIGRLTASQRWRSPSFSWRPRRHLASRPRGRAVATPPRWCASLGWRRWPKAKRRRLRHCWRSALRTSLKSVRSLVPRERTRSTASLRGSVIAFAGRPAFPDARVTAARAADAIVSGRCRDSHGAARQRAMRSRAAARERIEQVILRDRPLGRAHGVDGGERGRAAGGSARTRPATTLSGRRAERWGPGREMLRTRRSFNLGFMRPYTLTKTYSRFHDPAEAVAEICQGRDLHVEIDRAVTAAYG